MEPIAKLYPPVATYTLHMRKSIQSIHNANQPGTSSALPIVARPNSFILMRRRGGRSSRQHSAASDTRGRPTVADGCDRL
uniref:Uncharacterized protein n=1 Tax=Anopheles dirus TaxID=7168 RepID=A0A182NRW7_9DIPT